MELKDLLETVTPEMAKDLLSRNDCPQQRKISKMHVREWVRLMRSGQWDNYTPEPIKVSENNRLLDGQHRLSAIVEYGVPVQMSVIRGCKEASFRNLDSGRRRAMKDRLCLNENWTSEINKRVIAAINSWLRYGNKSWRVCTSADIEQMYFANQSTIDWLAGVYNPKGRTGRMAFAVGFCMSYPRAPTVIDGLAKAFYWDTRDNRNAIALRELAITSATCHANSLQNDMINKCCAVCRAEIEGRELKRIYARAW